MSEFITKSVQSLQQSNTQGLTNLEFDGKKLKWLNDLAELKDKQDQSFSPPRESFRNNQNKHSNACNDKCPCDWKSLTTELEGIKLDIVILQSQLGTENEKSTNAYEQTSKLQLELKKEQHMNAMLQDRITRVEEERDSLRLVLKLLMQDQNANSAIRQQLMTQ